MNTAKTTVAMVTGVGPGTGAAVVRRFARGEYAVAMLTRTHERLVALELALACDLIWAAASARFGQVEALIGTTTLLGGVQRLAERAGPSRAREIIG